MVDTSEIKYVCWNITTKCNKKCVYCFRELFGMDRSLEDNIKILHKLYEAGVNRITFSGGEPLSYEGIYELAQESKRLGIQTYIVTNGSYLNKDNIERALDTFDRITFSCDSTSSYVNKESGRGENNYEEILYLVKLINMLRPGYRVEINSVVTRNNIDEAYLMRDAMRNELFFEGVKRIKYFQFYPIRGAAKLRSATLSITDEQFEEVKRKLTETPELFDITFKDIKWLDRDIVITPSGSLNESQDFEDVTLVGDILTLTPEELRYEIDNHYAKKKAGGRHV